MDRDRRYVRKLLGRPDIGTRAADRWHWITGAPAIPIDNERLTLTFSYDRVARLALDIG